MVIQLHGPALAPQDPLEAMMIADQPAWFFLILSHDHPRQMESL
jgi:hypothetical protein